MPKREDQDQAASVDEVLEQHGRVHGFSPGTVSTRPNTDLKYVWIFPAFVLATSVYVTSMYEILRDTSVLLNPVFARMERSAKTIADRPLFLRINRSKLPLKILAFLDRKVDHVVQLVDGVLPGNIKELGSEVLDVGKSAVADFQMYGPYVTAKGYFDTYEPVATEHATWAYQKAMELPLVPQAVACSNYGAVKVNKVIGSLKGSRLPLVSFLPLLPVKHVDVSAKSE